MPGPADSRWSISFRDQAISERYAVIGGFTHGFDYLRIILAMAVLLQHSILTSYGTAVAGPIWDSWARTLLAPILPMFFGLSGFLVTGSLKKNPTVTSFMTLRAVRIVPALAVEVLLSALLLGPILTTLPLADYFSGWDFWRYLLNVTGLIHYQLPGVFETLPMPGIVNISLWTIPYELECYLVLMVLYFAGAIRRPGALLVIIALCIAAGTIAAFSQWEPYWAANHPLPRALVVAFLVGVACNLFADRIRLSRGLALAALLAMAALTVDYRTIYLATVPAVYLCIYLGMMHPPRKGFLFTGDYSYGLYLFAFPIQQTYTLLFPAYREWYANAAFTIVFGLVYAGFSWWCIEKPVLSRKQHFVGFTELLRSRIARRFGRSELCRENG